MQYRDLRDFIDQLERDGDLKRISRPVATELEITEISDRVLRAGGPALLFENPGGSAIPLLANLFGTEQRVARALGEENADNLSVGKDQVLQIIERMKNPPQRRPRPSN